MKLYSLQLQGCINIQHEGGEEYDIKIINRLSKLWCKLHLQHWTLSLLITTHFPSLWTLAVMSTNRSNVCTLFQGEIFSAHTLTYLRITLWSKTKTYTHEWLCCAEHKQGRQSFHVTHSLAWGSRRVTYINVPLFPPERLKTRCLCAWLHTFELLWTGHKTISKHFSKDVSLSVW